MFENDFTESSDFHRWNASGRDWFDFHSGTWCGPPVDGSLIAKLRDGALQGWNSAYKSVRPNVRNGRATITGPTQYEIEGVSKVLREILTRANEMKPRTLVVLMPSKPTALDAPTKEAEAYDTVIGALKKDGPIDVPDLRPPSKHTTIPALFTTESTAIGTKPA